MKIGFLTQYYPPEVGAPQTRISELVARFRARDHDVSVLTAMPNYPVGKIYPGFGGAWSVRDEDGTEVVRTWVYATQGADYLRRLTNYLSFAVSSGIVGTVLLPRTDFLFVESPPLFLGLTGLWFSRLKDARMIFNVSDLWPESAVYVGAVKRGSLAYRMSERLEGSLYKCAWVVSGQSRTIVENVSARFPGVRTYHLSNGADTDRFHPDRASDAMRAMMCPSGECTILYAGLHGLAQGLDQVLLAASLLPAGESCRFVFVGDGPLKARLRSEARGLALENVTFADPVPSKDVPAIVASADIAIIPLKTSIPGAIPSKLYESMASGRPVVYVGGGEGAEIVRQSGAGLVVQPGDVRGIAEAIRTLSCNTALRLSMGSCGREAAVNHFDRSLIAGRFIDFLEDCL